MLQPSKSKWIPAFAGKTDKTYDCAIIITRPEPDRSYRVELVGRAPAIAVGGAMASM